MPLAKGEYEVVDHGDLADIKVFLVRLSYRNPHIHREFELCQVISGSVRVSSGKGVSDFSPGGLFLVNPHETHEICAIDSIADSGETSPSPGLVMKEAVILTLQVSPRWCERFFPRMAFVEFATSDMGVSLGEKSARDLRAEMWLLALAYFRRERAFEFECVSRVSSIFHLLMTGLPSRLLTERERSARVARSDRVKRITEYVEANFTGKILLSDIARREGLTLAYLSHFFRDNFSMSFQRFVTLLRFDEARYLVERTDMSITDISLTCGFSDYRYLNSIYSEKLGIMPAEYRKARRAGGRISDIDDRPPAKGSLRDASSRGAKERFCTLAESIAILERLREGASR